MPIPPGGTPEERLEALIAVLEKGPASYFMNGRAKWTMTVVAGVATFLIGQALIGGFYFIFKAPTTDWVEARIDEKIKYRPITKEAEMRVGTLERNVSDLKVEISGLSKSNTRLEVQMETIVRHIEEISKEVKFLGLARGGR